MIDKLLTIEEVSEITGIAVKTLYVRGGGTNTLPRIKLGGSLRFREQMCATGLTGTLSGQSI